MLVLQNNAHKEDGKMDGVIMIKLDEHIFGKQFKNMVGIILNTKL